MKTLEILACEHAAIGGMIDRLEAELDAVAERGEIDGEALDRLLGFFEEQVDGHHQEKEERVFLRQLMARAEGGDALVVRSALDEHASERELLAMMRGNVEGASYGEPNSLAVVVRHARRYVRHQREHTRWEQAELFSLALRLLSPEDDRVILEGFRRLDDMWGTSVVDSARILAQWLDLRGRPAADPDGAGPYAPGASLLRTSTPSSGSLSGRRSRSGRLS